METQNTKVHSKKYPKWLYKEQNGTVDKVLCGSSEIEDDWNTRGYFEAPEIKDEKTSELMPSQVAKDAPAEPESAPKIKTGHPVKLPDAKPKKAPRVNDRVEHGPRD